MRFAPIFSLLLGLCACGGAPTRPSAETTAAAMLRHVPAEAPYWAIYVGSEADHSYEDQLAAILPQLQALLAERGPQPSEPGVERAMWLVAERLDGRLNAAGLAELGFDRYLKLAVYPVADVFPALRVQLLDAGRFDELADAIAAAAGAPAPRSFASGHYWRVDSPSGDDAVLLVRDADSFTIAFVLAAHIDDALAELTGQRAPARSLTVADLKAVAKPLGVIPVQLGLMRPESFLALPLVEAGLEGIDRACVTSLQTALSRTPRWVLGARRPKLGESLSYLYQVDLAEPSRAWWAGFLRPAPGALDAAEGTQAYMALGLSEDGLRAALVKLGQSWVEAPSRCESLTRLNVFAPMLASGALPPPDYQLGGLTGAAIALRDGDPDDPPVDMVLYTQSTTTLRDLLSEYVPELTGLPEAPAPVPAEDGFVLHRKGLIGFGTGTRESLGQLARPPQRAGPFLRFWMSAAFAAKIQTEDLEEVADGALWDKFLALNGALAANDVQLTISLGDAGFVMEAVTRRVPAAE